MGIHLVLGGREAPGVGVDSTPWPGLPRRVAPPLAGVSPELFTAGRPSARHGQKSVSIVSLAARHQTGWCETVARRRHARRADSNRGPWPVGRTRSEGRRRPVRASTVTNRGMLLCSQVLTQPCRCSRTRQPFPTTRMPPASARQPAIMPSTLLRASGGHHDEGGKTDCGRCHKCF